MSGRGPYLVFAVFLGVAVALLLYRFGVMPLGWSASIKPIFDVAPAVLVVTSWQLVKRIEDRRWPVLPMIGVGLVAAAAALGGSYLVAPPLGAARLAERQLPGFSISLPAAEEKARELAYTAGRIELVEVAGHGGRITVRWEPGGAMDDEELALMERSLAGAIGAAPTGATMWPGPAGQGVPTVVLSSEGATIWGSVLVCGDRRLSVVSGGPDAMGALHRRILPTIGCRPEPAREAELAALPWTIALPAGWALAEAPAGQVLLSDGESALMVRGGVEVANREALPKVLGSIFTAGGMNVTLGAWDGDRVSMQGTMNDGGALAGWVWLKDCPGSAVIVMAMTSEVARAAELSELVTKQGRCLRAGEAAPPWPKAPAPSAPAAP